MPVFIASLVGAFLRITASFVGRVLVNLGIAVITYKGIDTALEQLKNDAVNSFMGLPGDMVSLLSYMRVGEAISIITSALAARLAMTALNGQLKSFVKK